MRRLRGEGRTVAPRRACVKAERDLSSKLDHPACGIGSTPPTALSETGRCQVARAWALHLEHFFNFLHEESVEPTNNVAERALRPPVQWRKTSFGTRSDEGERAVERLLTVTRTCQLQQLSALVHLAAAIRAHRRRQVVASLPRSG